MGWASGFATGTNMARQWIDTYNQANTQRELKALDEEREERKRGLGRPATLDELNAANAETDRLQQSDTDTFGLTSAEQAKFNNRKVESGTVGLAPMSMQDYYSRKAAVYNKYGNHQMADQLDQRAYQMGRDEQNAQRQSRMDESTLKTQAQLREHTGLQITAAQRAQADDQAWRNFNAERSQLKNPDDMTAINALAKKHLNYDQQLKLVGDMTKMGELEALQLAQSTAKKVRDARNLAGLAIAFREDPDLDPGSYFDYRTDPKTGAVQVQFFNADKSKRGTPIQYNSEAEAYYSLGKSAVDPASIYTFLREQQDRALKNAQTQSEIDKNKSMTNNYNAEAWYTRAGKPGAGGLAAGKLPDVVKKRVDVINADIGRLQAQYTAAYNMGDKAAAAAILKSMDNAAATRDGILAQYEGGQPAAKVAAPKAGDVVDGYKFKGGDPGVQGNWEPVSEANGAGAKTGAPVPKSERDRVRREREEAYANRHTQWEATRARREEERKGLTRDRNAQIIKQLERDLALERNPHRRRAIQERIDAAKGSN